MALSANMTAQDYRLDDQVGFLMRRANQRHLAIFARRMEDLTPTQFATMAKLHELGSVSQNELGRRTAMDAATMKGVIDRLAEKGYVESAPDPDDRRRRRAALTDAGKARVLAAFGPGHDVTDETLEPLSQKERREFLRLLAKLADAL